MSRAKKATQIDPALALTGAAASLPTALATATAKAPTIQAQHAQAMAFRCVDDAGLELAASATLYFAGERGFLEDTLASATDPIKAGLKVIQGWISPGVKLCSEAEQHLKREAQLYRDGRAEEVARQLTQATSVEEVRAAQAALVPVPAGLVEHTTWEIEITDPSLLPSEYWIPARPDLARLEALAREHHDRLNIPGVRAVRRASLRRSSH